MDLDVSAAWLSPPSRGLLRGDALANPHRHCWKPNPCPNSLGWAGAGTAQFWAKSDALVEETNRISSGTTRTGYVVMNQTAAARAEGMHRLERIEDSAVVAVYYGMVDAAFVDRAHRAGKEVRPAAKKPRIGH